MQRWQYDWSGLMWNPGAGLVNSNLAASSLAQSNLSAVPSPSSQSSSNDIELSDSTKLVYPSISQWCTEHSLPIRTFSTGVRSDFQLIRLMAREAIWDGWRERPSATRALKRCSIQDRRTSGMSHFLESLKTPIHCSFESSAQGTTHRVFRFLLNARDIDNFLPESQATSSEPSDGYRIHSRGVHDFQKALKCFICAPFKHDGRMVSQPFFLAIRLGQRKHVAEG